MQNFNLILDLSLTTKALILVNEFATRRMEPPMLAELLQLMSNSEEEYRSVVELVENELRAANYPAKTISSLVNELAGAAGARPAKAEKGKEEGTRHIRSAFHAPFDSDQTQPLPSPAVPKVRAGEVPAAPPRPAPPVQRIAMGKPAARREPPTPAEEPPGSLPPAPVERRPIRMPPGASPSPKVGAPSPKVGAPSPKVGAPSPKVGAPKARRLSPRSSAPRGGTQVPAGESQTFFGGTGAKLSGVARKMHDNRTTVLVADDDNRIRMIYRIKLEEAGYHVVEAEDGQAAWEQIKEKTPALVVLDMKMPRAHGLEVMNRMVDENILIPVIICSAYDQLAEEFVVATYPQYRYLVKPIGPEQILSAVRELIEASK